MKLKLFLCTGLLALSSAVQAGRIVPNELSEVFPSLTLSHYLELKEKYNGDLKKISYHVMEEDKKKEDKFLKNEFFDAQKSLEKLVGSEVSENDFKKLSSKHKGNLYDMSNDLLDGNLDEMSMELLDIRKEEFRKLYEKFVGEEISSEKFDEIYNAKNGNMNVIVKTYIPENFRKYNTEKKYDQNELSQENLKLDLYKDKLFDEMKTQIKLMEKEKNVKTNNSKIKIHGKGTIIVPQEIISAKQTNGSLKEILGPKLFKFVMPLNTTVSLYSLTLLFVQDEKGTTYPAINPHTYDDNNKTINLLNEMEKCFTQDLDGQKIFFKTTNKYLKDPETGKQYPFVTITTKKPVEDKELIEEKFSEDNGENITDNFDDLDTNFNF